MITADYKFSRPDYLTLSWARVEPGLWAYLYRLATRVLLVFVFLLSVRLIVRLVSGDSISDIMRPDFIDWGSDVAFAILLGIAMSLVPFISSYTHYPRISVAGQSVHYELAADGLHWLEPMGAGTTPWTAIKRVVEKPNAIVLFISRVEGYVLPRRAFADGQFEAAREFIAARTTKKSAGLTSKS